MFYDSIKKAPIELPALILGCLLFVPSVIMPKDQYLPEGFLLAWLLFFLVIGLSVLLEYFLPRLSSAVRFIFGTLALYVFIASIFFPIQVGVLDGSSVYITDFDRYARLVLLIVCLLAYKFLREYSYRILLGVGILGLSYSIYTTAAMFNANKILSARNSNSVTELGKSENVFILVMDMFQGVLIKDLLDNNEAIRNSFDGFTYYTNTVSAAPFTYHSTCSILAGEIVSDTKPSTLADVYKTNSIFSDAKQMGFATRMHFLNDAKSRNDTFINIIRASSLRYMPFSILPLEEVEFGWISKEAARKSLIDMINNLTVNTRESKTFNYYHSLMTHQPVRFTSEGFFSKHLSPNDTPQELMLGLIYIQNFLAKLKSLGIYDKTTVIITGDHGNNTLSQMGCIDSLNRSGVFAPFNGHLLGQYDVALFIKPRDSRGQMQYSKSSVILTDLRKTLFGIISPNVENPFKGFDILKDKSLFKRDVNVVAYKGDAFKKEDYFSLENWKIETLHMPLLRHVRLTPAFVAPLGQPISFQADGPSSKIVRFGWDGQENTHRWTNGSCAGLSLQLGEMPADDLRLEFDLFPYRNSAIPFQEVKVMVNGNHLETWKVENHDRYSAVIPAGVASQGQLDIRLDISSPAAPCDHSDSPDCRLLGVAVRELIIVPAEQARKD